MTIDINQLYKRHFAGVPISFLAREMGMSTEWLREQFVKRRLPTISKMDVYERYSREIIELYSGGKSMHDIRQILNIPENGIHRILRKHNVCTQKTNFVYRNKFTKYTIDENYFDEIDAPEKAYILGFLYADGNAHKKHHHITLKLQERDKYILEQINEIIKHNKPLHFNERNNPRHQNQYTLKITNTVIYNNLIKYGVVPNKTFIVKFPNFLADNLVSHFIRGYFDGDGCLYISTKRGAAEWSFVGTTFLCESIGKILKDKLGISYCVQHDKRCTIGIDKFRIRKSADIINICKWMYNGSTIHLDRKYDKYLQFVDMKR